ncbi:MAG: hypothetical protein COB98_01620 [Flavobacteriaceae bacterium]|nr:MAG: hypothetical protein COB98_01620 [Flavobacteriaceae bacterium]
MSLKKIISSPITKEEKGSYKNFNASPQSHERINLLAELCGASNIQVLHNITKAFFKENEDEIKGLIAMKQNKLNELF